MLFQCSIESLLEIHDISSFSSGKSPLDAWLRGRALRNQGTGDSRTFVAVQNTRVIGFYALVSAAAARVGLPGALRRNAPDPVPLMLLAQLAVDQAHQRKGLGQRLLRDALSRIAGVAPQIGFRAVATHPIDGDAERFYGRYGFVAIAGSMPPLMVLPRWELLAAVAAAHREANGRPP